MIVRTAWKNVWRNKVRSLVVIVSVTIGIFGGVFAVAVMNGAIEQRLDAALNDELSHIQINKPGFRDNMDISFTIDNTPSLEKELLSMEEVEAVSHRTIVSGMANTATKSSGVQINGIDPDQNKSVFRLWESLVPGSGSFLDETGKNDMIFIGKELAKELNIIRYSIEESTLNSLANEGLPEELLTKLEYFKGERFNNEKSFIKSIKAKIGAEDSKKYGRKIAEQSMNYRKRSKLTLTFIDKNAYQTGGMFRVAGIYDIKNNMYEKSQVFILNSDLHRLTGLSGSESHIINIRLDNLDDTDLVSERISENHPELKIMNWKEIQPDLAMMTGMVEVFYMVFMIIILAALAFGIVNTMLMVVLERTKELGMLTAIGMNKKRVFRMIMTESVFLSIVGGLTGMLVSYLLIVLTAKNGINFSQYSEGFEAMGFSAHIYPSINAVFFLLVTLLIIITGILSSIYPALKALKLDPADALRTE